MIRFPKALRPDYGLFKSSGRWKVIFYLDGQRRVRGLDATTVEEARAGRDRIYAELAAEHGVDPPGPPERERGIHYRKPWVAWDGKVKVGEFDSLKEAKTALRRHKILHNLEV